MRPTFKSFIIGTLIGAFVAYSLVILALTNTYGRMSNHLDCDMSKDNTEQYYAELHSGDTHNE